VLCFLLYYWLTGPKFEFYKGVKICFPNDDYPSFSKVVSFLEFNFEPSNEYLLIPLEGDKNFPCKKLQ